MRDGLIHYSLTKFYTIYVYLSKRSCWTLSSSVMVRFYCLPLSSSMDADILDKQFTTNFRVSLGLGFKRVYTSTLNPYSLWRSSCSLAAYLNLDDLRLFRELILTFDIPIFSRNWITRRMSISVSIYTRLVIDSLNEKPKLLNDWMSILSWSSIFCTIYE